MASRCPCSAGTLEGFLPPCFFVMLRSVKSTCDPQKVTFSVTTDGDTYAYNPRIQKTETGELWVWGHHLQSQFRWQAGGSLWVLGLAWSTYRDLVSKTKPRALAILAETWVWLPAPTWYLTIVHNFSSRKSNALFWLFWAPGKYKVHRCTGRQNTHMHKNLKSQNNTYKRPSTQQKAKDCKLAGVFMWPKKKGIRIWMSRWHS